MQLAVIHVGASNRCCMIRDVASGRGPFLPAVHSRVACKAMRDEAGQGPEQLDPEMEADFKELMNRVEDDEIRKVLKYNKAKLVKAEVTSKIALHALTLEKLRTYGLSYAAAGALKLAFPNPTTTVDEPLTAFFQALCTANEQLLGEGDEAGPALLTLMADVIFPELRPATQQGRGIYPTVLVRKCWKEFRDLILKQGPTLVVGIPGIGKSVFAWWFIRCLVERGFTVVYRQEACDSLLCKDGCVTAGTHSAFNSLRKDTNTWWVYDAMQPDPLLVSMCPRILVVSSPNRDRYKAFQKAPGVVKMVMPRWSLEEIKLALKEVYPRDKYPGMTASRVENLFVYYNGVPRHVLGRPSEMPGTVAEREDLSDFNDAVGACDAAKVLRGAVIYESVPENYHRLLHLIPTSANYRQYRTKYASQQAFLGVWERAGAEGASSLQAFWQASAGDSSQAGMRGQILEAITKMDLGTRPTEYDERCLLRWFDDASKSFARQKRRQVESTPRLVTIEPGRRVQFTFDNTNYAQQLQDSWQQPGVWSSRLLLTPVGLTFPEVYCVILPAPQAYGTVEQVELYQITVSTEKDIHRQTLADILSALPDAKKYILYFVVPKEHFRKFTVTSISRGDVGEGQARLDRLEVRVIANKDGVNVLHSYSRSTSSVASTSSSSSTSEDGMTGDDGELDSA